MAFHERGQFIRELIGHADGEPLHEDRPAVLMQNLVRTYHLNLIQATPQANTKAIAARSGGPLVPTANRRQRRRRANRSI